MHTQSPPHLIDRHGITLLEVLMAMFVLAVGILSIFGLFTAGRELEARAAIKSDAIAYAGTLRSTIANQWIDNWQDWLYATNNGFARVGAGFLASGTVGLPLLIDPCGLSLDTQPRSQFLRSPAATWDWSRMTPLNSGVASVQPFARITLPLATSGTVPFSREGSLAGLADQDSIEYTLPANDTDPPLNAFELGRRKRGSDLVPALFVARTGTASTLAQTALVAGLPIRRTLLIFHKPAADVELPATAGTEEWPAGYLELEIQTSQPGLVEARVTREPQDAALKRRSLRPGNWLLIAEQRSATPPAGFWYETRWVKMKSATASNPAQTEWLLVIDGDNTTTTPAWCYAFERLVHVVDDFDPVNLP